MGLIYPLSLRFKKQVLNVLQRGEGMFGILFFHTSSGLLDQSQNLPEPDSLQTPIAFRLSSRRIPSGCVRRKLTDHCLNQRRSHFPIFGAFSNVLPSLRELFQGELQEGSDRSEEH